jgi:uncharacterized protein involved in exopolysaccharide biosynthesis
MQNEGSGFIQKLKQYAPDLRAGRVLILAGTIISAAIVAGLVLARPAEYESEAIIILPTTSSLSLAAALPFLSKEASQLSVLGGIASSPRVMLEIARRENMKSGELRDRLKWNIESSSSQLQLTFTGPTKERGVKVLGTALEVLDSTAREVGFGIAKSQSIEIEQALRSKEGELAKLEDKLVTFQKKLRTVPDAANPLAAGAYFSRLQQVLLDLNKVEKQIEVERAAAIRRGEPDYQTVAPALAAASWKKRLADAEYELQVALTRLGPSAPEVESLRRKLDVTRQTLKKEASAYVTSVRSNVDSRFVLLEAQRQVLLVEREFLSQQAKVAPDEALEFQRMLREIEASAVIVKDLRKQFETARLESQVYKTQYTVLQPPRLVDEPVNKEVKTAAIIAGFSGFIVSCGCIIFAAAWRKVEA